MKKILFMLIAFCAITISANAQTGACKVKGTNSTVYVSVTDWSPDGTVQLSIDSDANTRVSFEFFVHINILSKQKTNNKTYFYA